MDQGQRFGIEEYWVQGEVGASLMSCLMGNVKGDQSLCVVLVAPVLEM